MGNSPEPGRDALEPLPPLNPKVAARTVGDETLVLTPHDSVLHTLNPMATRIWSFMTTRSSVEAVVAAIVEEFDVDAHTAEADLRELLADLREKQILV